jgi:hypothetical protein
MRTFEQAFRNCQERLGMLHYSVTFKQTRLPGLYADANIDADGCVALIRYDQDRCEKDNETESAAIHEAIHLLTADLMYAIENGSKAIRIEEERLVRRLEPIILRGLNEELNEEL